MQGALPMYGKSSMRTASKQNCATSARGIDPASPSMTLTTPVGGSTVKPPGRTMQYSSPEFTVASSWLFLSKKIFFMAVHIKTLKKNGAWFSESPAPILVTTASLLTPFSFMAAMTLLVPSVSMVSPTSAVFPPRATITPSTSPFSKTLSTSPFLVTSPAIMVRFSFCNGLSASAPPLPAGTFRFEGFRVKPITLSPSFRA
mmetsp:Transcript_19196/g.39489  ORF Transcript_19196/g.39489 Transcript_19196/m.39489 type:complete len:201 (+) Transcript_19196:146-748(+)